MGATPLPLLSASALLLATACTPAAKAPVIDRAVDAAGTLHVPDHYRASYQALGSWAVAAEPGPGSQGLHNVYASPGVADAYRRTGHFPDGAVLVKEVFDATTSPMTTGTVSRAAKLKGWFVMVRDSKNTHPGNKLWGDGWGWAWFDADNRRATKTVDYKAECLACHEPARKTDLAYVEGYPVLMP